MDEAFVQINGELHYLWRAVDHEGEVLEVFVAKRQDREAALRFLKRGTKLFCRPRSNVSDRLRSYGVAMKIIGNAEDHACGHWVNNRAENSRWMATQAVIFLPTLIGSTRQYMMKGVPSFL